MSLQGFVVALLVVGCCVYAVWTLMPSAARRGLARRLQKLPLPPVLSTTLRRIGRAAPGCGCDGCDRSTSKAPVAAAQPIRFQPRPRR